MTVRDLLPFSGEGSFWVLSTLVKSTVLLVTAAAVAATLRRASAALRHLVWGTAMLMLLVLPVVSIAVPWRLAVLAVVPEAAPPAADIGSAATGASALTRSNPQIGEGDRPGPLAAGAAPAPSPGPVGAAGRPITLATLFALLLGGWALGTAVLLGRLGVGAVVLARVVRRATPLDTPDWRRPLLEAADRLALGRLPRLVMSERLPMPFACGVIRPAIVLPGNAAEWSDRRRRAVLFHELAHLSRFDLTLNALGQVACALYWFHPLVWVAARRLRSESERACDDLVLGVGTRASEYADHLLQIACRATRARTPAVALPMAQRHEFEGRMLAILERGARRDPASRRHATFLGALALGLVFPLAALAPRRTAAPPTPQTVSVHHDPDTTPATRATPPARFADPGRRGAAPKTDVPLQPDSITGQQGVDSVGVVAALIRALRDSVPAVREDAAYALGRLEATAAVEPLGAQLARDPTAKVREMSAWALGQIANRSATPTLGAAAQHDSSEAVRAMAVWALGQIEDAAAVAALVAVLRDASAEVRGRAAWALGTIEPDAAPVPLVGALDDRSADVRLRAAWALGRIGDPVAVPRLGRALTDSTAEVRRAALWALGQIGGDAAADALLKALDDPDPEVRARAARALGGAHGDPWPWPWPMPIIR